MEKFNTINNAGEAAFSYGDCFFQEPLSSGSRLTIGPATSHVDLLMALAATWETQEYYILYVLIIPNDGIEMGRYQSPLIESLEDLQIFLATYEQFLESDGRHHIWVASAHGEGQLIYDRHNIIYAYGDLPQYEAVLRERGFSEREVRIPSPHAHHYPTDPKVLKALLAHFPWHLSPLRPEDEH
ncbi:hypothetical protein [Roseimicrobium sp. ORNL1]|uniref:hypothetical protein n=1 Tax=Roseimicrobium sp. ORNL1 TaxID=2711231 RepID=UPI0013E13AB6|nr:hypothetical protein [Roseimicrobium sp. ORNL1]QIF01789.1 hypothetical protein G5S37_09710 [Roseimicrobium sp. ORNL1]